MKPLLESLVAEAREAAAVGRPASYIPALASADPRAAGLAIAYADGSIAEAGDSRAPFTLQSVSKALALCYVLETRGEDAIFSRVGKEPTGDPFNSIIRLETSSMRKPFNPMINAGAIVVTSLMPGRTGEEKIDSFRVFAARTMGAELPQLDELVYRSEAATASRNRAIAWFLEELRLLDAPVDITLDAYFRQCAILVDAVRLARFGCCLARDGVLSGGDERVFSVRAARLTKSLMLSCGLYDGSGEFCAAAGIPAKSGVGGGIVACARNAASASTAPTGQALGIGAYGPALEERGNSIAAQLMIRSLSEKLELFAF
jgi:glutaminase